VRYPHQVLARPVQKFRARGKHHVLGLNHGVDDHRRRVSSEPSEHQPVLEKLLAAVASRQIQVHFAFG
jgi:hypothetical protein